MHRLRRLHRQIARSPVILSTVSASVAFTAASVYASASNAPVPRKKLNENIFELYAPPNAADHDIDIIFIHGLGGNGLTTWSVRDNPSAVWPETWLPERFPNARVLSISYEAPQSKWLSSTDPLNVFDQSKQFAEQLSTRQVGAYKKPIIFVTHSLGGLMLKQMLIHADKTGNKSRLQQLLANTKAVAFYAVPHQGSKAADMVSYFKRLLRTTELIQDLTALSKSVVERNADYKEIEKAYNIQRYSFVETQKMPLSEGGIKVVEEWSARHGCGHNWTPINANHSDIVKPVEKTDQIFVNLCEFIMDVVEDMEKNKDKEMEKEKPREEKAPRPAPEIQRSWHFDAISYLFSTFLTHDVYAKRVHHSHLEGKQLSALVRYCYDLFDEVIKLMNGMQASQKDKEVILQTIQRVKAACSKYGGDKDSIRNDICNEVHNVICEASKELGFTVHKENPTWSHTRDWGKVRPGQLLKQRVDEAMTLYRPPQN